MKYHLTLDGENAACGLISQRPDTFLYNLTGFNAHCTKECECKKCSKIAATMPTKSNWPIETSNNLHEANNSLGVVCYTCKVTRGREVEGNNFCQMCDHYF